MRDSSSDARELAALEPKLPVRLQKLEGRVVLDDRSTPQSVSPDLADHNDSELRTDSIEALMGSELLRPGLLRKATEGAF